MHQKLAAIPDPTYPIRYPDVTIPESPAYMSADGQIHEAVRYPDLAVAVRTDVLTTIKTCLQRDARARMTIPELLSIDPFLQPYTSTSNGQCSLTGDVILLIRPRCGI